MRRDTELQHLGEDRQRQAGAASPPIYRTSLFAFPDCATLEAYFRGDRERHLYSRDSNPTVGLLETKVAALEGAEGCIAFASGMGAVSAVLLSFLSRGDHLVVFSRSYVPTLAFARRVLPRMGVEVTILGPEEVTEIDRHIRDSTRLIYLECPASLTFECIDLEAVAAVARARGIPTVTDSSWASPVYHRPLSLGVDMALHSGTKYVGGHSDLLLGLLSGSARLISRVRSLASLLGACLSPADASLAIRGLRTLPIRLDRHRTSALELARRLERHPRVSAVLHPALESFPTHELWARQFSGSSGLFSFVVDGDARRLCDTLRHFLLGVSWGGHESLAFPAVVARPEAPGGDLRPDVPDGLVRLSVGLEDPEDLWEDLQAALERA